MTSAAVQTDDTAIDGPHGPIPVRVYRRADADGPADRGLVWAHGGAFIGGDLDMPEADWTARELAGAGIPVVSVDYRLAPVPETYREVLGDRPGWAWPAPSDDVVAAWNWAAGAGGAGLAARWSLGGASAGGNLAAGAALRLRDGAGPLPESVVLAYPLVHRVIPPLRPELLAGVAALQPHERLEPPQVAEINDNYLGGADPAPAAFPGGAGSAALTGLPRTLVLVSDADDLRPSGEHYAAELAAAGVEAALVVEPGSTHGHLNRPEAPEGSRSVRRIVRWLRWEDGLDG